MEIDFQSGYRLQAVCDNAALRLTGDYRLASRGHIQPEQSLAEIRKVLYLKSLLVLYSIQLNLHNRVHHLVKTTHWTHDAVATLDQRH